MPRRIAFSAIDSRNHALMFAGRKRLAQLALLAHLAVALFYGAGPGFHAATSGAAPSADVRPDAGRRSPPRRRRRDRRPRGRGGGGKRPRRGPAPECARGALVALRDREGGGPACRGLLLLDDLVLTSGDCASRPSALHLESVPVRAAPPSTTCESVQCL